MEKASERDKEYMRRLGRYVAEANEAAREAWLALPPAERIARSERLCREYRTKAGVERALREDDPSPFYERARRLGLINR